MAESAVTSQPIKVVLTDAPIPEKVANAEKEEYGKDLKKGKEPVAPKDPEMNLPFLFGFVGTILVGSFHYGSLNCLL